MKMLRLIAVVLAIATSCSVKEIEMANIQAPSMYGYIEGNQTTKTAIKVDGEGVGTIWWKPADNINVFFGSTGVKYYSTNEVDATTVVFETDAMLGSTESASSNKWGLYPYDSSAACDGSSVTTTIPAAQQCIPETFGNNLFTMIAHTSTNELHFKNVCGGIKFSLSRDDIQNISFKGNNNEDIVGQVQLILDGEDNPLTNVVAGEKTIILTPSIGSTFASGANYYLVMLPTVLSQGFTMIFETETEIGTFEYTAKSIEIKRSIFAKKADIDTYASFEDKTSPCENLSLEGTANCYIVSNAGDYCFNATVKGNSSETVGSNLDNAVLLWESFGTNVAPKVGDLITNVSYRNDKIYFTATEEKGNAVIAIRDDTNKILWSWHIWLTDTPSYQNCYNNKGALMDRNLGATSTVPGDVHTIGLLYQWGRKDPFMANSSYKSTEPAKATIIWPQPRDSKRSTITSSINAPTTFFINLQGDRYYDWDSSSTNSQKWNSSKTMYDPCPVGYKVPTGGYRKGFFYDITQLTSNSVDWPWDKTNRGMNFSNLFGDDNIWFPESSYIDIDGSYAREKTWDGGGNIWLSTSASSSSVSAYCMYYGDGNTGGHISLSMTGSKSCGYSVRCIKE